LLRINKNFYLCDRLAEDLEAFQVKDIKTEFESAFVSRLKDTLLKVVAQLLGDKDSKAQVKKFYDEGKNNDRSLKLNSGFGAYLGGKLKS
jgi:hypothetical protein